MNKKIAALALAAALACALAVPAFAAAGDAGGEEHSTDLTVTVPSTYVLSIPANQSIAYGALTSNFTGNAKLSVTGNVAAGKKVTVTVDADTALKTDAQNTQIPFTLVEKGQTAAFTGAEWTAAELRAAAPKTIDLAINITKESWDAAKSGSYKATISFTANLA